METKLGLWIDDERPLPAQYAGWEIARNYSEAIDLLSRFNFTSVSLDHDIASFSDNGREMTGYDIAVWLVDQKMQGKYVPEQYNVHSANPVGRQRIQGVIDRYLT